MTAARSHARRTTAWWAASLACACLVAAPAVGQEKGDQYEVTVKMEMKGVPMALPPQTTRICMARNARDESFVPMQKPGECKVTNTRKTGNTVSYRMECSGKDPLVGEGEVTYAADGYSGKMHMTGTSGGEAFDMSQTYVGRKIGECANPLR